MVRGFGERVSTSSFSQHCLGDGGGVEVMVSGSTSTTEQCARKMGGGRVKIDDLRSPIFIVMGTSQTVEMKLSRSDNTGCNYGVTSMAC